MGGPPPPSRRLDKWLWHARVTKSRTAAQNLVAAGLVRVNRMRAGRASYELGTGDILTIAAGGRVRVLKVVGFAGRRGPASEARLLFAELSTPTGAPGDEA